MLIISTILPKQFGIILCFQLYVLLILLSQQQPYNGVVYGQTTCDVPKLLTSWEEYPAKPDSYIAEAQGNFIGKDFFIFGGFENSWWNSTNNAYYYNTRNGQWYRVDNIPTPNNIGITHMPTVKVGRRRVYGCGGYLGHVGETYLGIDLFATNGCYVYTHKAPAGKQWKTLPSLPANRAGGALFYDKRRKSLIVATGADKKGELDNKDVWELSLRKKTKGWVPRAPLPYGANHVGGTSVTYGNVQRHYVMGGQNSTDEGWGNSNLLYEYTARTNTWKQKMNMTHAVGHISASTLSYNNSGILIMGGARNGYISTSNIYYYSIACNNWTYIGDLPTSLNTPVCSILNDWLYCQSGVAFNKFSWKVKIGSTIVN